MRWGWFALALLLTFLVQTSFAHVWLQSLDLLAAFALVCGFLLPAEDACLAGWITGFVYDLGGSGAVGPHALAFGLAVLPLVRLRELINRELWWVRWLAGFVVLFPAEFLLSLYARFMPQPGLGEGQRIAWWQLVSEPFATAVIGGLVAALVVSVLTAIARRRRLAAAGW